MTGAIQLFAVGGMPEVRAGNDLADLICGRVHLADGDVLAVTSKVVTKAEGGVKPADRDEVSAAEAERVVARRGATVIARTRHGLVLAASGVDTSNVELGHVAPLPADPDAAARQLRDSLLARTGRNVAVVITDTAGRAWRRGQTDIAVGCAGIDPLLEFTGRRDHYGNQLTVTAPAVADEVAAAADLVKGKLHQTPVAVLRNCGLAVHPPGEHGAGAGALVRPAEEDLFGLGAREAVLAAVERSDAAALGAFAAGDTPLSQLIELAGRRLDHTRSRLMEVDIGGHPSVYGLVRPGPGPAEALVAVAGAAERLCAVAVASSYAVLQEPRTLGAADPIGVVPAGWRAVLLLQLARTHP